MDAEQFAKFLQQHQEASEKQHQKLIVEAEKREQHLLAALNLSISAPKSSQDPIMGTSSSQNSLPSLPSIESFEQEEDNPTKFENWLKIFEISLECTAPNIASDLKTKFFMTKLSPSAFDEYVYFILPKEIAEFTYEQTIVKCKKLFGGKQSIYVDRLHTFQLEKSEDESFMHYANRVKASLKCFKFTSLSEQQFNCLILMKGLNTSSDETLRARILHKLNLDAALVNFDDVISDCNDFLSLKTDVKSFEKNDKTINYLHKNPKQRELQLPKFERTNSQQNVLKQTAFNNNVKFRSVPKTVCYYCGELHWSRDCPYSGHKCNVCSKMGHLEVMCKSRGKSNKVCSNTKKMAK